MFKRILCSLAALALAGSAFAQNSNASPRALQAAMAHFNANARAYGLTNPSAELKVRNSFKDSLGQEHIRFDQLVNGVKVFEGEAISHVDSRGNVTVTNALRPLKISTTPAISEATAVARAVNAVSPRGAARTSSELVILPAGVRAKSTVLVYRVTVETDNEIDVYSKREFFIDARTGTTVWSFDATETGKPGSGGGSAVNGVSATGNTMWTGVQTLAANNPSAGSYTLQDTTRGIGSSASGLGNYTIDMAGRQSGGSIVTRSTAVFGDGNKANTDSATAAADAHFGLMKTWDYYKNIHARNGIDNVGTKTYARVHYGRNYENAFWSDSCFCMTYGDGASTFYPLVDLDVAGHEMTHGVTARSANLTYSGESGGLNESNSDIQGTMVEFYANNATNLDSSTCTAGNQDCPDYWIGEKIYRSNYSTGTYVQSKALRYMDDPTKDGRSPACWTSTLGSLDVHYTSGPSNHAFYLLAHGGTSACNGSSVAGVGNTAAAKIWYRAVNVYMTSSTNYAGARVACLKAAADLYGTGSATYNAVAAAFSAINVN